MTHLNDTMTTNQLTTHRKYSPLTKEELIMIATLKSQGLSNCAIGRQLGSIIKQLIIISNVRQFVSSVAKCPTVKSMIIHTIFIVMKLGKLPI